MAYFTIDEINDIKNSITNQDFYTVVNYYGIPMQKNSILCPFHADKHFGSARISGGRRSAYCFVCERQISLFDLIMHEEGVDFSESVKIFWCDIMGNPAPEREEKKDWKPRWNDLKFIGLGGRSGRTQISYRGMVPRLSRDCLSRGWMADKDQYDEQDDAFACGEIVRPVSIYSLPDEEFWPLVFEKAKENLGYREKRLKDAKNPLTPEGYLCQTDRKNGKSTIAGYAEDVRRAKYLVSRIEKAAALVCKPEELMICVS